MPLSAMSKSPRASRLEQLVPRSHHRPRPHSQLLGERIGQVHLEADEAVGIHGILKDVGCASLAIGAPRQFTAGLHRREPFELGGGGLFGGLLRWFGEDRKTDEEEADGQDAGQWQVPP